MKLPKEEEEECSTSELEPMSSESPPVEQQWDFGEDYVRESRVEERRFRRWYHGQRRRHRRVARMGSVSSGSGSSSSDDDNKRGDGNWRLVVGTFLINLIVPSVASAFGVFMLHTTEDIPSNWMYIIPVVNVVCCTFFEPLCHHLLFVYRINRIYLLMTGVALMAVLILNILNQCFGVMVTTYGVGAGIGSCIVVTYMTAMLEYHSPIHRGTAVAVNHVATATGYVIMPMILHMLMEKNDFGTTAGVQAMIIIPLFTIAIFILPAWNPRHPESENGSIDSDTETMDRSNNFLMQNVGTSWRNLSQVPRSDIQYYRETFSNGMQMTSCRSPVLRARRGPFSVDIMPRIIEEPEDAETEGAVDDNNTITTVQRSEIEYDQFASGLNNFSSDADEINADEEISTEIEYPFKNNTVQSEEDHVDESTYWPALDERPSRVAQFAALITDTVTLWITSFIVNPLMSSLRTPYFFPVLWIKFGRRFCSMTFITLAPSLSKSVTPTNTNESCMSGLIIAAFTGMCTLSVVPFYRRMANKYQKCVLALGCVAEVIGFYVLTFTLTDDNVKVGCALYGFGVTITTCSIPIVVSDSMGFMNQRRTAVVLNVLCTILIILASITVLTVWMTTESISNSFHVLAAIQMVSATVWLVAPVIGLATFSPRMGIQETLMPAS